MNQRKSTSPPITRREVATTLREISVVPSRGKGQNFLIDSVVAAQIVDLVGDQNGRHIVEIGPGLGALTTYLIERYSDVRAIELDTRLANELQRSSGTHLTVINGDALTLSLPEIGVASSPYVVVGNLPYSVGTGIIRRFLEEHHPPTHVVVMVQREVAERMCESPPHMSILSVATQFYADPEIKFHVPPSSFKPSPKVESAVVELTTRRSPPLEPSEQAPFFELVNAGFRNKRKQLANSLSSNLGVSKPLAISWISSVGLPADIRAERLTLQDWIDLHHWRTSNGR